MQEKIFFFVFKKKSCENLSIGKAGNEKFPYIIENTISLVEREKEKGKIYFWCVGCLSLLFCADSNLNDVVMSPKNFSFTKAYKTLSYTNKNFPSIHIFSQSFALKRKIILIFFNYCRLLSNIISLMMMLYNVFSQKIFL